MKLEKFEKIMKYFDNLVGSKFFFVFTLCVYQVWLILHEVGLKNAEKLSSVLMFGLFCFLIAYLLCSLVLILIKKHEQKKSNIEKLIEEETKENK